jgi:hypothetical protein
VRILEHHQKRRKGGSRFERNRKWGRNDSKGGKGELEKGFWIEWIRKEFLRDTNLIKLNFLEH